jgi:2,5-furandicarboxylate decarboxylase 1
MAGKAEQKAGGRVPDGYTTIVRPDLAEVIPLIKYSREDATPYLTAGIVLVKDPANGQFHICYVRMAFIGGNKLIFNAATPRIKKIVASTVGQGRRLDLTILIGPPTEIILTAGMSMPKGIDKFKVAVALANGEIKLVKDKTTTYAFPSEFVFKATVIPEYTSEGPFGDLKGLYSFKPENPICLVRKVIHRKKPLFHSVSAGTSNEHFWLVTMGVRYYLEKLKQKYDYFLRYSMPTFGVGRIAFLVMKENFNREEFVQQLWKIPITRTFVFVNRDVNTRSAADILWAVTQRARDVDNFMFSEKKHPVFQERKLVIDATVADYNLWDNRRIEVFRGEA